MREGKGGLLRANSQGNDLPSRTAQYPPALGVAGSAQRDGWCGVCVCVGG